MLRTRRWGWGMLVVLAACGGSGGGGGGGSTVLAGNFKASLMAFSVPPAGSGLLTITGTGTADGSGSLLLEGDQNDNGNVTPTGSLFGTSLAANGELEVLSGTTVLMEGWLGESGNLALLGTVQTAFAPGIFALTRCWPGTATTASLTGSFHYGFLSADAGAYATDFGSAAADGVGTLTIQPGGTLAGYTVAPDGTTVIGLPDGDTYEGGLLLGADYLVASGELSTGDSPLLIAFSKFATAASVATLSGTYRLVGYEHDLSTDTVISFTGTMTADGAGNATIAGTQNSAGVIVPLAPVGVTYTVAANGTVNVLWDDSMQGAVTADGDSGFLVQGGAPGDDPAIYLFTRQ